MLEHTTVVLVAPERTTNIGAAARAMKNCGITRLALVRPVPKKLEGAYRTATHAADVLDGAQTFGSLLDATAGADASYAVTRRGDLGDRDVLTPQDLAAALASGDSPRRAALVFGPEHRGLSNEEIGQCRGVVTIPSAPGCPSLNLSHAVMVVCHAIFSAAYRRPPAPARDKGAPPGVAEVEALLSHAQRTLLAIGFLNEQNPHRLQPMFRSILSRARVTAREMRVLRGIAAQIDWATGRVSRSEAGSRRSECED